MQNILFLACSRKPTRGKISATFHSKVANLEKIHIMLYLYNERMPFHDKPLTGHMEERETYNQTMKRMVLLVSEGLHVLTYSEKREKIKTIIIIIIIKVILIVQVPPIMPLMHINSK